MEILYYIKLLPLCHGVKKLIYYNYNIIISGYPDIKNFKFN